MLTSWNFFVFLGKKVELNNNCTERQKTAIKVKFRDSGESFCVTVEFTLCFHYSTVKFFCQYFPLYSGLLRYVDLKRVALRFGDLEPRFHIKCLLAPLVVGIPVVEKIPQLNFIVRL